MVIVRFNQWTEFLDEMKAKPPEDRTVRVTFSIRYDGQGVPHLTMVAGYLEHSTIVEFIHYLGLEPADRTSTRAQEIKALFGGHDAHLTRGERAVIPLVAQDQRATRVAFSYIRDTLVGSPLLNSMVADVLTLEIILTNRTTILCFPCTLRSLRGWSVPAGVLDELGYFRLEGQADSDAEIQAAIRRGMLAFPAPRLVKISTPYLKSGVLFDDFRRGFGQDNPDLLVWRASSQLMNPTILTSRL
jgi:hypothetical protein